MRSLQRPTSTPRMPPTSVGGGKDGAFIWEKSNFNRLGEGFKAYFLGGNSISFTV